MGALDQWLWRHEYWLPPGITWEDMQSQEGSWYPRPRDLLVALPLAVGFISFRYVFERLVARPLGRQLGVCDRTRVPVKPVPHLEAFYTQHSHQPSQNEILGLTKQCDLTQRQVETWFRHRRNQDRPNNTRKFYEACWRFAFYMVAFSGGLAVLVDAPWFWDQRECWNGFPLQPISDAHYWYYMMELGFYWSLLLCVSVDIKRKDFREQIVHHVATISLLGFSYCSNYVRIGTLVMLVHDSSDFLLEVSGLPVGVCQNVQLRQMEEDLRQPVCRLHRGLPGDSSRGVSQQSDPHDPGPVHGGLHPLFRVLLLQRAAAGAAGPARLLGLAHPAHGLQVHLPGHG
ncbi:ceramide synthase 2-like isoform X2 [Anguilla rostrata]|uniref:ceramide synthase 2-like isoform X2 n=1 Tax=Anguilla rostrata TaxID=7938 RepID=UPI0030CEE81B